MKRWTVADIMTADVIAIREDAGYREIVTVLAEHRISAVPVVDDLRLVTGVVSETDLLYKVEFAGAGVSGRTRSARRRSPRQKGDGRIARDLMTSPALTVVPGTSLNAAARLMVDRGVKQLPVVDGEGVLVGIVARADLLKPYRRTDEQLRREIVDEVLGRTMWLAPSTVVVTVSGGVAVLAGLLDRRSTAELAARLSESVPGVVAVENRLTFELDDASDLAGSGWYRAHPFSTARPSA